MAGSSPLSGTTSMALQHGSGRTLQGGQFGIGTGTHSLLPGDFAMHSSATASSGIATAAAESFSNLCERRLAFELSTHPTPEQATNALIHRCDGHLPTSVTSYDLIFQCRVVEVSGRKNGNGYITCPQLHDVIASVGLTMSPREVEVLATGE